MKLNEMAAKNLKMHKMKSEKSRQDEQDSQVDEFSAIADGVNGASFLNPCFFLSRTFALYALFRGSFFFVYPWAS